MPQINRPKIINSVALIIALAIMPSTAWAQRHSIITEYAKLLPHDGVERDSFGRAIAIENDIVAVGSYWDDDQGPNSGSVYLFNTSTGAFITKLLADDGAADDRFGNAIAIDNGIAAIGAYSNDDNGVNSGSAYLFDLSTGTQIAKLLPHDGAQHDLFGHAIAIHDGIVVVGALYNDEFAEFAGAAYVFDATTGEQIVKLHADDAASNDYFGKSVAIHNGIVAVGAPGNDDQGGASGSAYLFDAFTGDQIAKLLPSDGDRSNQFGETIALEKRIVAVGAPQSEGSSQFSGSVYLFDAITGQQNNKIFPLADGDNHEFSKSIAIDQGLLAVGATSNKGFGVGMVFTFNLATGEQFAKSLSSDSANSDEFAYAIGISQGIVASGAFENNDQGSHSGSAYLFQANATPKCLYLNVQNLVAGQLTYFTIKGGTPGAKNITVYGTTTGQTILYRYAGFCARFGIKGINQARVIGGLNRIFDDNGETTFKFVVPSNLAGRNVLFQTAEGNTCPDKCMSNRIEATIR